jgi:hypothetical protein
VAPPKSGGNKTPTNKSKYFILSIYFSFIIKPLLDRGEIGEKKRGEKEKYGNQCMNLD